MKKPFFSKKAIFRAEKDIFSKSSFYTKIFTDPKYSFSVCQIYLFLSQRKLIFFTILNLHISHDELQMRTSEIRKVVIKNDYNQEKIPFIAFSKNISEILSNVGGAS